MPLSDKSLITYKLNNDGSIILKSLSAIALDVFKKLSDSQLEELGLYREERLGGAKYFEILNEGRNLEVKQAKLIALAEPQTIESLAVKLGIETKSLNVPTLKKIYIKLVEEPSDRTINPQTATRDQFIKAFKAFGCFETLS